MYFKLVDKLWHVIAILRIIWLRIVSCGSINISTTAMFRKGFTILTSGGGKINISRHVFFNRGCSMTSRGASITIGEGTIFGENVKIYDHNHCYKDVTRPLKEQGFTQAPVTIGKHCWIASNVVILKGVTIGDHAVIGAGCIIHKDVSPNTLVVNKQELTMRKIE